MADLSTRSIGLMYYFRLPSSPYSPSRGLEDVNKLTGSRLVELTSGHVKGYLDNIFPGSKGPLIFVTAEVFSTTFASY